MHDDSFSAVKLSASHLGIWPQEPNHRGSDPRHHDLALGGFKMNIFNENGAVTHEGHNSPPCGTSSQNPLSHSSASTGRHRTSPSVSYANSLPVEGSGLSLKDAADDKQLSMNRISMARIRSGSTLSVDNPSRRQRAISLARTISTAGLFRSRARSSSTIDHDNLRDDPSTSADSQTNFLEQQLLGSEMMSNRIDFNYDKATVPGTTTFDRLSDGRIIYVINTGPSDIPLFLHKAEQRGFPAVHTHLKHHLVSKSDTHQQSQNKTSHHLNQSQQSEHIRLLAHDRPRGHSVSVDHPTCADGNPIFETSQITPSQDAERSSSKKEPQEPSLRKKTACPSNNPSQRQHSAGTDGNGIVHDAYQHLQHARPVLQELVSSSTSSSSNRTRSSSHSRGETYQLYKHQGCLDGYSDDNRDISTNESKLNEMETKKSTTNTNLDLMSKIELIKGDPVSESSQPALISELHHTNLGIPSTNENNSDGVSKQDRAKIETPLSCMEDIDPNCTNTDNLYDSCNHEMKQPSMKTTTNCKEVRDRIENHQENVTNAAIPHATHSQLNDQASKITTVQQKRHHQSPNAPLDPSFLPREQTKVKAEDLSTHQRVQSSEYIPFGGNTRSDGGSAPSEHDSCVSEPGLSFNQSITSRERKYFRELLRLKHALSHSRKVNSQLTHDLSMVRRREQHLVNVLRNFQCELLSEQLATAIVDIQQVQALKEQNLVSSHTGTNTSSTVSLTPKQSASQILSCPLPCPIIEITSADSCPSTRPPSSNSEHSNSISPLQQQQQKQQQSLHRQDPSTCHDQRGLYYYPDISVQIQQDREKKRQQKKTTHEHEHQHHSQQQSLHEEFVRLNRTVLSSEIPSTKESSRRDTVAVRLTASKSLLNRGVRQANHLQYEVEMKPRSKFSPVQPALRRQPSQNQPCEHQSSSQISR